MEKEIVLLNLKEAEQNLKKSTDEGLWDKERIAINDAIKFIKGI